MNKDTKQALILAGIFLSAVAILSILAVACSSVNTAPPHHKFDAEDYFVADQWCKSHGYTTTQDVVHGVSGTSPSTVVSASCVDPNDRMGSHIPAPQTKSASAPTSSASGALK